MKNIKKILALALVAISLLAFAAPALAVTTGRYNTAAVFLRPAVDSSSYYGKANNGTTCEILDSSTGSNGRLWYKVKITSHTTNDNIDLYGKTGWSWAQYITVTGGTTPSEHPQTITEAFGTGYIQQGNTGNYVRNVQWVLYWEGFLVHDYEVDGIFGPDTETAVRNYQLKYWSDLGDEYEDVVDGIVGPKTKESMWNRRGDWLMDYGVK